MCPYCGCNDYEVMDYDEEISEDEILIWHECRCMRCHKAFKTFRQYNIAKVWAE